MKKMDIDICHVYSCIQHIVKKKNEEIKKELIERMICWSFAEKITSIWHKQLVKKPFFSLD